ncbi:unnamed protein product [Nyctereutes procyonoides]|uniref:(raccoon dog) hypothetical protein n=1 Tax=Nyctereutes procyonoides TaxID=34880 RepID=A0A811ZTU3_NYCPR|nr:unnamed protein product [Nyctereutes procyonoides]
MEARPQGSLVKARASRSQGLSARDWGVPVPSSLKPRGLESPAPPSSDPGVQTPSPSFLRPRGPDPQPLLPQIQGPPALPPPKHQLPVFPKVSRMGCCFSPLLLPGPPLSLLPSPSFLYLDPMTFYFHISPSLGPPLWAGIRLLLAQAVKSCPPLSRSAAAGLARDQASLPPSETLSEAPGRWAAVTPRLSPWVWGQIAGSSALCKVTRGLALSCLSLGSRLGSGPEDLSAALCQHLAWPHPSCQPRGTLPSPSAQTPNCNPPHSLTPHPVQATLGLLPLALLYPTPQPALSLSSRDLTLPVLCSELSEAATSPRERGQGPQIVSQGPQDGLNMQPGHHPCVSRAASWACVLAVTNMCSTLSPLFLRNPLGGSQD